RSILKPMNNIEAVISERSTKPTRPSDRSTKPTRPSRPTQKNNFKQAVLIDSSEVDNTRTQELLQDLQNYTKDILKPKVVNEVLGPKNSTSFVNYTKDILKPKAVNEVSEPKNSTSFVNRQRFNSLGAPTLQQNSSLNHNWEDDNYIAIYPGKTL
ncbi:unnamed protein product, partial [Meganyctiphanes norvegica]